MLSNNLQTMIGIHNHIDISYIEGKDIPKHNVFQWGNRGGFFHNPFIDSHIFWMKYYVSNISSGRSISWNTYQALDFRAVNNYTFGRVEFDPTLSDSAFY